MTQKKPVHIPLSKGTRVVVWCILMAVALSATLGFLWCIKAILHLTDDIQSVWDYVVVLAIANTVGAFVQKSCKAITT